MIIQCQACNTKFRVGDDKVKPPGIKVRCSKCGEVFFYEFGLDGAKNDIESSTVEQPSDLQGSEGDTASEISTEPAPSTEEPDKIEEPVPQDETIEQPDPVPVAAESESTDIGADEFSDIEVENIQTESQTTEEEDSLSKLSKEIMAAQIGTDISKDTEVSAESESISEIKIDKLDELAQQTTAPQNDPIDEIMEETPPQPGTSQTDYSIPPQPEPQPQKEQTEPGSEYRTTNLVVDQDKLEQTYTKGTVASDLDTGDYHIKSRSSARGRRYSKMSQGGGFFRSLFKFVLAIVFLGALFVSSMYVLNEMKIYQNDYYTKFGSITGSLFGENDKVELNKVKITDEYGRWSNSKYGQVFVVSGEIVNRSNESINYVKLKVNYTSEGSRIFSQDVYAGNTLSDWEIKNKSFNAIQTKLLRKKGDISYEDVNNLDGLNFDIQPGERVPFFSIFPAQDKILGLKYRVEVTDFESSKVSKKP